MIEKQPQNPAGFWLSMAIVALLLLTGVGAR
jgi:hypothetical protein